MLLPGSQQVDAWEESFESPETDEHFLASAPGPVEPTGASIPLPTGPLDVVAPAPVSGSGEQAPGSLTEELPLESTHPGGDPALLDTNPQGEALPGLGDTSPGEEEHLSSEPTRVEASPKGFSEPPPPLEAARAHLEDAAKPGAPSDS